MSSVNADQRSQVTKLLPCFNCGICGYARCEEFAHSLLKRKSEIGKCRFLFQEIFNENRGKLEELLRQENILPLEKNPVGVLDSYEADFILNPLPKEKSYREVLYPFTRKLLKKDDIIRYMPLGCPIIHFARILDEDNGLITVHMIDPCHRMDPDTEFEYMDIGGCMVGGFEGMVEGPIPSVGETVRFLPGHCMMHKVHSGVVVQVVGKRIIIEGIDLKVWAPPVKGAAD